MKFATICTLGFILIFNSISIAQIGVNNTTPDPSSVLDLSSNNQGLLVPRMTTTERLAINSPANALLVFDTTLNMYFTFVNNIWQALNPWVGSTSNTTLTINGAENISVENSSGNVGVGTSSPQYKLDVNGPLNASEILINGSPLSSQGTVPAGGIIMWSGLISSIPAGWALCNGTNGTPNLSGRFIVGYNPAETDYNAPGKVGGEKMVLLAEEQIPPHTHSDKRLVSFSGGVLGYGANYGTSGPLQSGSTGGGQPHENRPPYFVMAYIMKL